MAEILCLANSKKRMGRCIAGIDTATGQWIRPVYRNDPTTGLSQHDRSINGTEPALLDVLNIPIHQSGPDEACQPENRHFGTRRWNKTGTISQADALDFAEDTDFLLHNNQRKVDPAIFQTLPASSLKSLQLIHVSDATFNYVKAWDRPEVSFTYSDYYYDLKVTDLLIIARLKNADSISSECLLSVSMATPYQAQCDEKPYCYKMVAGVIELD